MDKVKITNRQLASLTAAFICGTSILVASSPIAGAAKQDAWISILLCLVFGLFQMWFICFLMSKYPGLTFVGVIRNILGKWIGFIVAAGFVFYCILSASQVAYYINIFITIQAMPETPTYIINIVPYAVAIIALLYGLEATARSYELFIYVISFLFLLSMLMVLPNAKIANLQPVYEKGIIPILKGSILSTGFLVFSGIILMMIFPSNIDNAKKAKKSLLKGYLWGGFLVLISVVMSILVLGSTITASSQFPVYLLAKEISIGNVVTRFEFVIAAVWLVTVLARVILYYYASVVGLAQLLGLKDHKRIILPLGLIFLVMSGVVFPDTIYLSNWDVFAWIPLTATFGFVLPIILIIGFLIKQSINKKRPGDRYGKK